MKVAQYLRKILLVIIFFCIPGFAQTNVNEEQGLKPHDSLHGGDLDSVSLTSGGLVLHIPLASFPQRGSLDLSFSLRYSSKQWQASQRCSAGNPDQCTPLGWGPSGRPAEVASSLDWWLQSAPGDGGNSWLSVMSPDGNSHSFGGSSNPGVVNYPLRSLDASGLMLSNVSTVILPNGTRYSYPANYGTISTSQPTAVTDSNGNQISISSTGWTDTLGRGIPGSLVSGIGSSDVTQAGVSTSDLSNCPSGTASARVWNVPGLSSGTRTFKFCYANSTLSTNFQQAGVNEYPPTSTSLLSAIVLPDLTLWTLSYDNYGDVTRLGFPTGGSISYTYSQGPGICGSGNTQTSMWVRSRTVDANDGTGGHTWNYNYSGQGSSTLVNGQLIWTYSGSAVVTSPDGNDTVHTISSPVAGADCSVYDVQVQHYQGSAASGSLLKTVQTQYSGTRNWSSTDGQLAANIVPVQVTTTVPGGKTGKAVNTYDALFTNGDGQQVRIGSLLEKDEYDFSNTLVRSTLRHYLWQDNSTYKNNNFVSLPVSNTVCTQPSNCVDGTQASRVAQNTYGYDQVSVVSSGVTTPLTAPPAGANIRGNQTTASRWLNTTNSFISSTASYFDTGMKATDTDPMGNTTTYSYSSNFAGAYMTQTTLPNTRMPESGAPLVYHFVNGGYDFDTGLLTSFTDENNQTYTYQYDNMLRLTQANHPDGGQTLFTFPSTTQVERRRLISGSIYDDFKVNFDGVGRSIQSQQATPSGTVLTDITYDVAGRVSTTSNPYYQGSSHGSDPTYGVTQTQYDALGRAIKITKQDGSFSSTQYNAPAGDGAGSSVVCTTATDEAGKQRQVCADALGRMVKVLEPNPGAPATYATGSATVSGNEQTSGSATSGTSTVTIGGTEGSVCNSDLGCPPALLTYDSGPVSITANGVTKSFTYGRWDTPTTIATNLAAAFHNDGNAPVDATSSGAVVTLTARATGASTNYSLSASVTTNDPADFWPASFTTSTSGSTLTGGHDAGYDSGTVRITVNGTAYTVSYGQGSTSPSIASALAAAINGDNNRVVNASPTGSTVNLTARTSGPAGDYTLSTSYTWNTGTFASPSFTASTSANTLTGGYNASDVQNNPYVTTYQYNIRGDLLCVHQKATDTTAEVACTGSTPPAVSAAWRQRFFTYDSFSRLLTTLNPEAGQTSFQYDNNGNVTSKTSPAPNQTGSATVTITYAYDNLNRLLDMTYSDGTQNASNRYDYTSYMGNTFQNPIGRQVAATAAGGTIGYFTSYDAMGRVNRTTQCTPGVATCPSFTANYDLLGDMLSLSYPGNNFSVTYTYDSAARLTQATDSNGVTYAQNPSFLASGAMQEFASPNFNNFKYHANYNNRLQPVEIWAGSAGGSSALFDKQYSYNAPNTNQMNNGNIYTVTNVKDDSRTQSFTYDPLNRLISAQDKTHWGNTYSYDAWGNLQHKTAISGLPNGEHFDASANTSNQLSGNSYDAAGNVTNDGINGYTYDAENRIKQVGVTGGVSYTYDAYGRRVKKSTGTNYWYGPGGAVLAETDTGGNWTNYIFFGGQRLARNVPQPSPNPADIKYYITDHLHSTSVFADKSGSVLDDNDFYPWGGVVPGVGTTTSNNHYKFTGKERDTESGLDYFGARYYANASGRFMTPDWAAKPISVPYADFGDPQSLNLYSYVRNSPITRVDPDGHTAAGMDGLFRTEGDGETPEFNESHGDSGVDADYDSTTTTYDDGRVETVVHRPGGDQVQQQNISAGANSAAGGTLTGPYIADLKSPEIAPLVALNHTPSMSELIGDGECVTATKKFAGLEGTTTAQWRAGEKAANNPDIKPGTAIATFDKNGRYPQGEVPKNSGIYLSQGTNGSIWILDQWPAHGKNPANPPHPREVLFDNRRDTSNNSNAYSVIYVAR
ncbi:MAG TPA: BPSL0067 family protein [Candidatus Angelobacter sp.]|jgi:RHS repeat-associated protein|nr:BPSL0067 family protein [Candidatus Angelobacter sp.]